MSNACRILVTGAGGFVGRRLAARLVKERAFADASITLVDLISPPAPPDPRVRAMTADITRPADLDAILDGGPNIIFHLAGVLGGAAERDPALARRVNMDATLDLLERLQQQAKRPRLIFASSIAVFGPPLPPLVDDDTPPFPVMVYGAHKRMVEVAIEQFSARGWIDGIALRLPGLVANPDADARLKSAFLSRLFFDFAAGRDIVLPVPAEGTTWLISANACVDALLHAALLPAEALGRCRALTLSAQRLSIGELVAALRARFPASTATVRYDPDEVLQAQFAAQPPLSTAMADRLGFRHDGDIETLVARALSQG